jgi:hypothetical protein
MVFVSKPPINLFAGWWYLFDREYRQEVHEEWRTLPGWLVAMQVAAGACSIVFPLMVFVLLAFVFVSRHL